MALTFDSPQGHRDTLRGVLLPDERATRIAIETAAAHLAKSAFPRKAVFCCFSGVYAGIYERAAHDLLST